MINHRGLSSHLTATPFQLAGRHWHCSNRIIKSLICICTADQSVFALRIKVYQHCGSKRICTADQSVCALRIKVYVNCGSKCICTADQSVCALQIKVYLTADQSVLQKLIKYLYFHMIITLDEIPHRGVFRNLFVGGGGLKFFSFQGERISTQ